jgi:hypothetical protein
LRGNEKSGETILNFFLSDREREKQSPNSSNMSAEEDSSGPPIVIKAENSKKETSKMFFVFNWLIQKLQISKKKNRDDKKETEKPNPTKNFLKFLFFFGKVFFFFVVQNFKQTIKCFKREKNHKNSCQIF